MGKIHELFFDFSQNNEKALDLLLFKAQNEMWESFENEAKTPKGELASCFGYPMVDAESFQKAKGPSVEYQAKE